MREIIEGAAQVAQRTGVTIVVIGPQPVAAGVPVPSANGANAGHAPINPIQERHLAEANAGLTTELKRLQFELTKVARERDEAAGAARNATAAWEEAKGRVTALQSAGMAPTEAGKQISDLTHQRDTYAAKVHELQGLISQLQQPGATGAPVSDPGKPEVRFADYGIEFLGLSEDAHKKILKLDPSPKNVGDLVVALEAGKIKSGKEAKPQFTKDECIEVAVKVALGRVPASARPVASATAAPAGGGATDVPVGHKDQPWLKRLEVVRKKEAQAADFRSRLEGQRRELDRLEKGEKNPDSLEAITKLRAQEHETDKMLGLFDGQVLAFIFGLGLPAKNAKTGAHHTVDSALTEAGLVHLVQTTPVGAGA